MTVPVLNKHIRNVRRYRDIASVLLRYGFDDFLKESGLEDWISSLIGERLRRNLSEKRLRQPRAVRVRQALESLGPIYIKLGQVLSTRPDLIPVEWAEELGRLQSDCPRLDFEEISEQLDKEFNGLREELFEHIEEEALAAASLAQVHCATLKTGESIVLKILRPNVGEQIETDVEVLRSLAHFVEKHFESLGYSPVAVVEEFARELSREVDMLQEARSLERLGECFSDNEQVIFPKVYWKATTRRVLAMEHIKGKLLSRTSLDEFSKRDRRKIVEIGAKAVLQQGLDFGFFHADPHPGNLMILPGPKVCFLDLGMSGHLDRLTAGQLADLIAGVASQDLDKALKALLQLCSADPLLIENRELRVDAWQIMLNFDKGSLRSISIGKLLNQFFDFLRIYRLRCPSDIVFLIKAVTTIEGVGERLDPDFDIVKLAKPYVEELIGERYGIKAIAKRLEKTAFRYAELFESLPIGINGLLQQIRQQNFAIRLEHSGLSNLTKTIEEASRNISSSLLLASLMVGSSILVLAGRMAGQSDLFQILGMIGILLSFGATLWALFIGFFRKK